MTHPEFKDGSCYLKVNEKADILMYVLVAKPLIRKKVCFMAKLAHVGDKRQGFAAYSGYVGDRL